MSTYRMTLRTSKNKTYSIDWMWETDPINHILSFQLSDERPISKIAEEFEGCEELYRYSELEGDMTFIGYTRCVSVLKPSFYPGKVQIDLQKPM